MMLTCFIIDDMPASVMFLQRYIGQTSGLELLGSETDALAALRKLHSGEMIPDILFLDIDMPDISGMDIAKEIGDRTRIVFVTGHLEYGAQSYEVDAYDYLIKPFSFERFLKCVDKVKARMSLPTGREPYYFVYDAISRRKINIMKSEIIYLKAEPNYTKVVDMHREYLIRPTLGDALKAIADTTIIRVHKSYAINRYWLSNLKENILTMKDGTVIPVGRAYRKNIS